MPARNRIKQYVEDSYYHIYNRGVEKRLIFLDEQDYAVFLSYLKDYLLPKDEVGLQSKLADPQVSYKERDKILKLLRLNNFADQITLLAYSLMPNHFHLFVKQKDSQSINQFIKSLATRYTMYFNKKYERVGNLCQDVYKAVLVDTDEQFVYLSAYIHKQTLGDNFSVQQPSSYQNYLGKIQTDWVHPEDILLFFSKTNPQLSYQSFIEQDNDVSSILTITLDDS